jgi:hypothetical protein
VNRHVGLVSARGLLRWLGPALCLLSALCGPLAQAAQDAQIAPDTDGYGAHRAADGRLDTWPDARSDSKPSTTLQPAAEPNPVSSPPPDPPRAEEPARAVESTGETAFVQGQDTTALMGLQPRKRTRTKAQTRLTGLAAMAARIATRANLTGAGNFEAPRDMGNPRERRILVRRPEPTPQPVKPVNAPPPASVGVLDENVVKEIGQRKTMFRMCYESARRRGVTVTRADVKWLLSPDGSVRNVVVEVEQDDLLARCIRVIASRPFPTTVDQEIPVAVPLLFVSESQP